MSGKASRSKGIRAELHLRNEFRKLGYDSTRVPLSGSMQGYKGDVVFSKDGVEYTAEVKCRKDGFKSLYVFLDMREYNYVILKDNTLAVISYDLEDVMNPKNIAFIQTTQKMSNKLIGMKKWLQACDVLGVKNDFKKFIFIRYLG